MPPRPHRGSAYEGIGTAWNIIATLLAGMLVWGGLGWLADRWLDTGRLFTAIGLLVGTAGGIYLVYVRYGRDDSS
ncbi:MAG TPA: AtpZ/AtpI family protein [Actinomycetota bacterium]|nr:AtpZ/AtpI family protein [Actinomycetota bacterium]